MDTPWDRLLDLIDHFADRPALPLDDDSERTFASLCEAATEDGDIDRELKPHDVGRWLTGLVATHRLLRQAHPEIESDDDLAVLRTIVTRWLHPARPGR